MTFALSRMVGNRDVQCGAAARQAGRLHVPAEGLHSVDQAADPGLWCNRGGVLAESVCWGPGTLKDEALMLIAKILVSAAIVLGCCVGGAAPASADPSAFATLSCSCRETAPAGSPALKAEIDRGIGEGLSAGMPGLRHRPGPDNRNAGDGKS